MDEVIIAKRWFRDEEVKTLYNRGLNGLEALGGGVFAGPAFFTVAPTNLVFGAVPIGQSLLLSVVVNHTNMTPVALSVQTTEPFSIVSGPNLTVQAGSTGIVLIAFNPSHTNQVTRALTLTSSGGGSVTVPLSGLGTISVVDTDSDGVPDFWERDYGLNPNSAVDATEDPDRDGLSNIQEFQHRTFPNRADTDGDGVSDFAEVFIYATNPLRPDFTATGVRNVRYHYDRNDRLIGAEYSNGLRLGYVYDGNGNIIRQATMVEDGKGLPVLWRLWNGLEGTNAATARGLYDDPDRDGWSNYQEWRAGSSPTNFTSVPSIYGLAGANIGSLQLPFTPSDFVVGAGSLDGFGAEAIAIGADGNPNGTTNSLLILSQKSGGWTTQRVDVGPVGITSIAIGQPKNASGAAIYVGLREPSGVGTVMEIRYTGTNWLNTPLAIGATGSVAYVLGVRPNNDIFASFAGANAPAQALYSLTISNGLWTARTLDTNSSQRSLGTVGRMGSSDSGLTGLCLLDAGGIQLTGFSAGEALLNTNGLVAYYPFNGNANDESGNGQNGVIVGVVPSTTDRSGRTNRAYYFNGDAENYINVHPFNNFPSTAISTVFWFQTTNTVSPFGYSSWTPTFWSYGLNEFPYSFLSAKKYTNFFFGVNEPFEIDGSEPLLSPTNLISNDGQWHQFAVTWRSSDGDARLYKDGMLAAQKIHAQGRAYPSGADLWFGRNAGPQSYLALVGALDDVRIYNRVLSAGEISELFSGVGIPLAIPEPQATSRVLWRGLSLAAGKPRSGFTNAGSILYTYLDDRDRSGQIGSTDKFVFSELRVIGTNAQVLTLSEVAVNSTNTSYGLASARLIEGGKEVVFTAEPDGQIFSWIASNADGPLQRQLFSAHHAGKAWHALAGVTKLDQGEGLVGLRVDPSNPNTCNVIFWPPQTELPKPPGLAQTAPVARVLPEPGSGAGLAPVEVRVWDAEGNAATLHLEFQRDNSTWQPATVVTVDRVTPCPVSAPPSGSTHRLLWAAGTDLRADFSGKVQLRARASDVTLTGEWSLPVDYRIELRRPTRPTITDIPDQTVGQDSVARVTFTVGDAETPVSDLIVTAVATDNRLLPKGNILLEGTGSDRAAVLVPAFGEVGETGVTITVSNSGGLQAAKQFQFRVDPIKPTIRIEFDGRMITLKYTGKLQTADSIAGPWRDVAGSSSPWIIPPSGTQQFWRTRSP